MKTVSRSAEAAREATWSLSTAQRTGTAPAARDGTATSWVGVGGVEDAQALVERWLGPLVEHDAAHRAELVETLETFLANQRSWQRTAAAMNVHRQTVLYRVHKVEELTGARLSGIAHHRPAVAGAANRGTCSAATSRSRLDTCTSSPMQAVSSSRCCRARGRGQRCRGGRVPCPSSASRRDYRGERAAHTPRAWPSSVRTVVAQCRSARTGTWSSWTAPRSRIRSV